jgi:hypothetical protein
MAISTTGHRLLCILFSVYVLSKILKLCSAEGSSFRYRVEIHQTLVAEVDLFVGSIMALFDAVRLLFLKQHLEVDPECGFLVLTDGELAVAQTFLCLQLVTRLVSLSLGLSDVCF